MSSLHLTREQLETGLDAIRQAPRDAGRLEMIVRRPRSGAREVLEDAELDLVLGLVGDNWKARGSSLTADRQAHPDAQITVMNSRAIALVAGSKERWPLAGDQFYVDLDLSDDNLPPGTQLALGAAVIEITAEPHDGCRLFANRFGKEAVRFVNSAEGKRLHLRGLNAKVVQPGLVRVGDLVRVLR